MTLVLHQRWDRHQWVGERDRSVPDHREPGTEPATWSGAQMVGDRPGLTRRPFRVDHTSDGLPHGFSGFGISGIGGQRWALPASTTRGAARTPGRP